MLVVVVEVVVVDEAVDELAEDALVAETVTIVVLAVLVAEAELAALEVVEYPIHCTSDLPHLSCKVLLAIVCELFLTLSPSCRFLPACIEGVLKFLPAPSTALCAVCFVPDGLEVFPTISTVL